jgi:oligopeptide/dipeptide ABC transporter ATP-binding protein
MSGPLFAVEGLRVGFGDAHPVDGVTFAVGAGECLGLVGESGSGKSLTLRAALGLLPPAATVTAGELRLDGKAYKPADVRGHGISMIFQEPMSALNPLMRAGDLIGEALRASGTKGAAGRRRAVALMDDVGIPDPERRARAWPHELSGGMRQRVMIAMALAGEPRVLLCDEPTTALDVTVQDQILGLLDRLRRERGLAIVFVTHNLALVDRVAQRLAVMYAGRVIETGAVGPVLAEPRHPYTARLLGCVPELDGPAVRLDTIPGRPPDPRDYPTGCRFAPRCSHVREDCTAAPYRAEPTTDPARLSACIHWPDVLREETVA